MAGMSAAGVFADQIAGTVKEAFKFLFAVELRQQRLPDDFRFRAVQLARPAVQPVGQVVGNFQRQSLHDLLVTPFRRFDNTNYSFAPSRLCVKLPAGETIKAMDISVRRKSAYGKVHR